MESSLAHSEFMPKRGPGWKPSQNAFPAGGVDQVKGLKRAWTDWAHMRGCIGLTPPIDVSPSAADRRVLDALVVSRTSNKALSAFEKLTDLAAGLTSYRYEGNCNFER